MDHRDSPPSSRLTPEHEKVSPATPRTNHVTLILAFVILGMSITGALLLQRYKNLNHNTATPALPSSLQIVSASPREKATGQKNVIITFSDDVAPHKASHFFFLSPYISGKFTSGTSLKQVIFTPDVPFMPGASYSVKIGSGLTSTSNRRLTEDYQFSFYTDYADTQVQYVKDNLAGTVLSFAAQKPITFTIKKGAAIKNITTTIYRSSETALLGFLTYKKVTKQNDGSGSSYTEETFVTDRVETKPTDAVKTITSDHPEENLSLSLPAGIYYVESIGDKTSPYAKGFIIVNTRGLILRQDDKKVVLSAFDLGTNTASKNTFDVTFYSLENTPTVITQRSLTATQDYEMPFSTRVDLVIGREANESIIVPLKIPESQADIKAYADLETSVKMFLYTDRPIYKPNDTLRFRGIIRKDADALYKLPDQQYSVRVWTDNSDKPPIETTVQADTHGVFSGDLLVPDSLATEYPQHSVQAQLLPIKPNQYAQGYATFDVARYIKPEFDLKTDVQKADYTGGDHISFTVHGSYFDGKPLANQLVNYTVYAMNYYETQKAVYNTNFNLNAQGGMCGGGGSDDWYGEELMKDQQVTLDGNGTAEATITIPKEKLLTSQKITLIAKKKDKSGNEILSAATTVAHAAAFNIFFIPSATRYTEGDQIVAPFYAENRDGQKITGKSFKYALVDRVYGNKTTDTVLNSGTVVTDDNGKAIVVMQTPVQIESKNFFLTITASDDAGNITQNEKSLLIQPPEQAKKYSWWDRFSATQTYLKITSSNNSFVVGDTITLAVKSPKDLDALLSVERGRVYTPTLVHINQGDTTLTIPVTADLSPSVTVVLSFFADGEYYTEGLALNVPAMHKLLDIAVQPDKQTYTPGENAQIKITTRDANAVALPVQLSLGIVDKAIYALRKSATPPIHSSLYYFRPRSTNASSSLTWIGQFGGGGGGGGGGDTGPGKLVDTLYWNPSLSTNDQGEVTVVVPLGSTITTWKAQAYGSTDTSDVGQGEAEFIVTP